MAKPAINFTIAELVCDHLYEEYGEEAWRYLRDEAIDWIDWFREKVGKPVYVNTYKFHDGGSTQRGVRCNLCAIVKQKTSDNKVYVSPHMQGIAFDLHVQGMTTAEVHAILEAYKDDLPVPIRIEKGVPHVHIDTRNSGTDFIEYCRP